MVLCTSKVTMYQQWCGLSSKCDFSLLVLVAENGLFHVILPNKWRAVFIARVTCRPEGLGCIGPLVCLAVSTPCMPQHPAHLPAHPFIPRRMKRVKPLATVQLRSSWHSRHESTHLTRVGSISLQCSIP